MGVLNEKRCKKSPKGLALRNQNIYPFFLTSSVKIVDLAPPFLTSYERWNGHE